MSDLLSRMLARSTRPTSLVQPVLSPWIPASPDPASGATPRFEPSDLHEQAPEIPHAIGRANDPKEVRAESTLHSERQPPAARRAQLRNERAGVLETPPVAPVVRTSSSGESSVPAQTAAKAVPPDTAEVAVRSLAVSPISPTNTIADVASAFATDRAGHGAQPLQTFRYAEPPNDTVEVHVTIGHIEVRSAPAPAKPPARRPAPAHVSLSDYLQRRNGGSR